MFINVLTQVIILLVLIMIGFTLTKTKALTELGAKCMTDLVLYTVTPCVIIKSFVREFDRSLLKGLILSFIIATLSHILFIILSRLFFKNSIKTQKRVLQFGIIFSNCGFMSLPLQQALLGDIGVFYCASYIAVFNIFAWSYGVFLMSGDKKYITPKKLIVSPGIIGVVIGIIIFVFSVPIPKIIFEPITYMANLNTPLPMLVIGYHLANSNFFEGLKNKNTLIAIALRLVVFPLIILGLLILCGISGPLLVSLTICCCAPVGAFATMFAAKFGCDTPISVNLISVSTVLSLVTMPLIITISQYFA